MKKIIIAVSIALQLIAIALFVYYENINFTPIYADYAKYFTIILAFLTSAALLKDSLSLKDGLLLSAGMLLTIVIDYFLVIARPYAQNYEDVVRNHVIGMTLYGICQCIYFFRFQKPKRALILPFFLIIPAVLYFLTSFKALRLDTLTIVTTFYIQVLAANLCSAIWSVKNKKFPKINGILILTGMFIFVIGDITVVLTNTFHIEFFRRLIWVFYTPSQLLLSLSAFNYKNLRKEGD